MNKAPLIDLEQLRFVGHDLHRPECVLSTADGRLHVSDWRGGVTRIEQSGTQTLIAAADGALRPNGICLMSDGSYLIAQLGDGDGGIYRIDEDGNVDSYLTEVDGQPLPPTNFVHVDATGRAWVSVSTRKHPRAQDYRPEAHEGFIILLRDGEARIVADGLGYANECAVHPDGERLFVNETFARRLSSLRMDRNGDLGKPEVIAEFGAGTYPDGIAFDASGAVWITSIVSNRVLRVDIDGEQQLIIEDCVSEHVEWVEQAFQSDTMGREHFDNAAGRRLYNVSSLAFGGPDRRQVFLGSLAGTEIATFHSPIAGHAPSHWHYHAS